VQTLDVRQNLAQQTAAADEARNAPALHVLLRQRDEALGRRAPSGLRFPTPADFGLELAIAVDDLAGQPRDLQVRLDSDQHFFRLERLRHVVHGAAAKRPQQACGLVLRRHEEHGNRARHLRCLELDAHREAIFSRQDHIQQNHVGTCPGGDPEALLGIRCRENLVTSRFQHAGQKTNVRRCVVDDENLFSGHRVVAVAADSTRTVARIC
jgi:hypothetical protein